MAMTAHIAANLLMAGVVACTAGGNGLPTPRGSAPTPLPTTGLPARGTPILPTGYGARPETRGLVDPRAIVFPPGRDEVWVVEGAPARLTRVLGDGTLAPLAQGGGNGPWTGAAFVDGTLYVAEAGGPLGGRILRVAADGAITALPLRLPADNTLASMTAGHDGWLYVGVSSITANGATASGGDIPCQSVRIRGGGRVEGAVPCTGSVLRINPRDSQVAVQAWGFRAPMGVAFAPDGRLLVSDDLPRQVAQAQEDLLWQAVPGVWYGWPDYAGQLAMADPQLTEPPNPPPPPLAQLPGDAEALALGGAADFGGPGQAFVAVAQDRGQGAIVFTSLADGATAPFATNLEQPSALAFAPDGQALWVADAGTGTLWQIIAVGGP